MECIATRLKMEHDYFHERVSEIYRGIFCPQDAENVLIGAALTSSSSFC